MKTTLKLSVLILTLTTLFASCTKQPSSKVYECKKYVWAASTKNTFYWHYIETKQFNNDSLMLSYVGVNSNNGVLIECK